MRFASSGVRSSRLGLSCWSDIDMSGAEDEAGAASQFGAFAEHPVWQLTFPYLRQESLPGPLPGVETGTCKRDWKRV